ncbi:hypothetical protein HPHPH11_0274 [Helicobacter pylori Hp H-11]|nr:hypothetical protein HPHPH11_0274 [Helicobacter pylori Hp H-11]
MITYDIDKKQPQKSKKKDFRSEIRAVFIALILILAFYLIFKVEGV